MKRLIIFSLIVIALSAPVEDIKSCTRDQPCKSKEFDCNLEILMCEHKPIFPIYLVGLIGIVVLLIFIALANAGGIGGGEIIVPTVKIFFSFS